jgi:Ca-activated chloride channel family protein
MEIAQRGGGVARFLTSSPEEDDIATALDSILADWSQPVLAGLRLEVNRPAARAADREPLAAAERGWSAVDLGDLPAGRTVWVAGRVPRGEGPVRLRMRTESGALVAETAAVEGAPAALRGLFGARRLLGLEFLATAGYSVKELAGHLRRLGYDPDRDLRQAGQEGQPLYAENTRRDAQEALGGLLLRESLGYGLLTSATAFVAVRSEAGKPVAGTVVVANALPSGWSEDFTSLSAAPLTSGSFFRAAGMLRRRIGPSGFQPMVHDARALSDADDDQTPVVPPLDSLATEQPRSTSGSMWRRETPPASMSPEEARPSRPSGAVDVFAGRPDLSGGEWTLFDSERPGDRRISLPGHISVLRLTFTERTPDVTSLDAGLELWLFVGDLASPRARVSLVDLIRQGGARPLNLARVPGERVLLVLKDPNGAWAQGAPVLALALE